MDILRNSPVFWIMLSIAFYVFGHFLNKKFKTPLLNPLLVAIIMMIIFLKLTGFTTADFNTGGDIINMMLLPATALLAYSIYNQLDVLKKHFIPIIGGCLAGAITAIAGTKILCHLFGLDEIITASLIPKSVTTPIAIELSSQLNGMQALTVAAVVVAGISGAIFAPYMAKLFRIKNPVAVGTAIGACSHAAGTTRAITMGKTEGAMSSVSIGISGLITIILVMFL
jgi:predicted murein hydrolase (TIGR00659 family)